MTNWITCKMCQTLHPRHLTWIPRSEVCGSAPWTRTKYWPSDGRWTVRWFYPCTGHRPSKEKHVAFVVALVLWAKHWHFWASESRVHCKRLACRRWTRGKWGQRKCDGSSYRPLHMVFRYRVDLAGILRLMSSNISKNKNKLVEKQTAVACVHLPYASKHRWSTMKWNQCNCVAMIKRWN